MSQLWRLLHAHGRKRIHETERGGERLPGTVWGVKGDGVDWYLPADLQSQYELIPNDDQYWGRVQGNNAERRKGHPNQLPEVYLERLLRAYTNEGDRVCDPFGGSGTTAVVAAALNRRVGNR